VESAVVPDFADSSPLADDPSGVPDGDGVEDDSGDPEDSELSDPAEPPEESDDADGSAEEDEEDEGDEGDEPEVSGDRDDSGDPVDAEPSGVPDASGEADDPPSAVPVPPLPSPASRPQVGQAAMPWAASTFSATLICWERLAWSALEAYARPPYFSQSSWVSCRPP
jgi:hypothetical protein